MSIPTVIGGAPGNVPESCHGGKQRIDHHSVHRPATTNTNCWSGWKNLSEATYHANIRTAATGAKRLDLPLTSGGVGPIELIKRPATANENTTNAVVFGQRYFAQASLRILLSDRAADIMNLPTVTQASSRCSWMPSAAPRVMWRRPPAGPRSRSLLADEPINAGNGNSLTRVRGLEVHGREHQRFRPRSRTARGPRVVPAWLKVTCDRQSRGRDRRSACDRV